jgi:hypothetical protein
MTRENTKIPKPRSPAALAFIDVDGVLVDAHEEFRLHINEKFGLSLPEGFIPQTWGYTDVVPPNGQDWFYKFPNDWVGRVKPYEEAAFFLAKVRESGARVILISKVPMARITDRIKNLTDHQLYYDEFAAVPSGQKKSDFINAIRQRWDPRTPWLYLDDSASEIDDVLTNCDRNTPERIVSINRAYCQEWIAANPEKAKGVYWAENENKAYLAFIDTLSWL